jgi:hypothetical protein
MVDRGAPLCHNLLCEPTGDPVPLLCLLLITIAGHRHRGRRHRHPVSQSGTGAFRYRTGPSYPGTGLIRCRTVRHSGIDEKVHPSSCPRRKLKVVERYIPWTLIDGCYWCISAEWCWKIIYKYRNAGEKLVRHRHFYRQSISSVRHRHSGTRVSPVPLVTY